MYPPPPPSPPHSSAASGDRNRRGSAAGPSQTHLPPQYPNVVGHYFAGDSSSSSSFGLDSDSCNVVVGTSRSTRPKDSGKSVLQNHTYGFNEIEEEVEDRSGVASSSSLSLLRHQSSTPGFFHQQLSSTDRNGFSLGRPSSGGYGGGDHRRPSRSKAELSFVVGVEDTNALNAGVNAAASSSCMNFGIDNNHHNSWDPSSSNISFTIDQPGKRSKTTDFFTLETQFSMPQTSLEIARMENLMNIPEDSVPCRIRAKRGCATHPRSIAERERRTRISGKLKKLQELVPNMDKQTSYADMLDLAVDHIKGLQLQVEILKKDMEKCTCGACKR